MTFPTILVLVGELPVQVSKLLVPFWGSEVRSKAVRKQISTMFKFLLLVATLLVAVARKNELDLTGDENIKHVVKTPIVVKSRASLPTNFDYRPLGLLTTDLNQHIPVYWYEINNPWRMTDFF
jgi:hypothetical protein